MMFAEQLIESVEAVGGVLTVLGDRIRCRLPEDAAHLLDELKAHKGEVIVCLKRRDIPPMPEGVRLLEWNPKPAPVLLTTGSLVTDVDQFIADTLAQLDRVLNSKQGATAHRKVRELVDQLEQCGVVVKIAGVGSASGGGQ
jgi:hypothetical protein